MPELIKQAVTLREAAEMLAVSPLTIRRAIRTGKIRAFQFNPKGPYRISLDEISKFVNRSTLVVLDSLKEAKESGVV
jgi:excisionase family DNA binding protein